MLDLRFRPLEKWKEPTPLGKVNAQFKMPYNRSLDRLEYELRHLGARDILIESGFELRQIRNDGWPYSGQEPSHQGVVLYFTGKDGPMRFPCGTYSRWRDNLHAIMLTLENLRAIDRYGVTLGHQQYLGFKALPAPEHGQMSTDDAAAFISAESRLTIVPREIVGDAQRYAQAYRAAARRLHPDVAINSEGFVKLSQAKALLDQHHGLTRASALP